MMCLMALLMGESLSPMEEAAAVRNSLNSSRRATDMDR